MPQSTEADQGTFNLSLVPTILIPGSKKHPDPFQDTGHFLRKLNYSLARAYLLFVNYCL